MDRAYIDLHLVVDRYLQGRLSASEAAEFEERLAWDQPLVEELELAEQLRDGLRSSGLSGDASGDSSSRGRFRRWWSQPQYAAAASFMLATVLATIVFTSLEAPGPHSAGARTDVIPLVAVRGTARSTITVNKDATTVLLIDESEGYMSYRVSIAGEEMAGGMSWSAEGVIPTYPQSLAISLPPGFLDVGRYVLTVEGELTNASGTRILEHVRDIPFEVEIVP